MNSKTVLTAILGAIAGLGLAMGTMLFAQNTNHMGNFQTSNMMGQNTAKTATNLNTYDSMHGQTTQAASKTTTSANFYDQMHGAANKPASAHGSTGMMGQAISQHHNKGLNTQGNMHQQDPVTTHHANYNQPAKNKLCHEGAKT